MPLYQRRFLEVDRDNLDDVMKRFKVRWRGKLQALPGQEDSGSSVVLSFSELDDFHPDRLVQQVPALRQLQEMLGRLEDSEGLDEAEANLRRWIQLPETRDRPSPAKPAADISAARLLDSILDQGRTAPAPGAGAAAPELQRFLQQIVEPHLVRVDSARQEALRSAINDTLSYQVNSIIHDPSFQALEAAWRSLHWLAGNVETNSTLRIWVVHLKKEEVLRDVVSDRELERSELARLLLDPASVPGSDRPSLFVGDYAFSSDIEDLAVLERFGNIGARLAAPFIATASSRMIGHQSLTAPMDAADLKRLFQAPACEAWRLLRKSASARWIVLTMPRVLCRLPYGKELDPAETFGYEEGIGGLSHENLLWGNSAFAVAAVYAAGFAAQGWQMNLAAGVPRLDGFPLYVYKEAAETVTKPCAEVLLSERVVEAIMEFGLLPVVCHRDTDVVSLPSLQTISDPRSPIPL
jgi:type VI secretion system protein ImpC